MDGPPRYVGTPDIHDGYIREVLQTEDHVYVKVQGDSGRFYMVRFDGVQSIESKAPEEMMLYALAEWDTSDPQLRRYEFINWYDDIPEEAEEFAEEVAKRLVIMAAGFELKVLTDEIMDYSPGTQK